MEKVECAPFLRGPILEDPDPASHLYIPKAPPRNYETLSQAIEAGKFRDQINEPAPKTMEEARGINIRDRRKIKIQRAKIAPQTTDGTNQMSNMQGFGSQMNFTQDPYSMGGDTFGGPFGGGGMYGEDPSPFGGGAPFGGDQWGGGEEDTFSGMGKPYSDLTGGPDPQATRTQNDEDDGADDGEDDEDDHGENHYEDETDYGEGEDGEVRLENKDDDDEIDQKDLDPSSFPYSTPMNEPGDEQIMQDAKILRERDGIAKSMAEAGFDNHEIQTGDGEEFNNPVASETVQAETGSNVVQEEVRPKKKLKEKFMRDREQLERLMNAQGDSIYRRADEPPPGRKPPADDLPGHQNPGEYPPSRHPRETRIMSGQEIKQQMAMQKLARAALKAIGKRGGAKTKRGGKVKVMFM
ncbi:uncharacterized protein LOC129001665 [Macrosteles quadrilineatus]|uniref:uncharacterized protein LOC129001665 n=1 Tax=Macrosteles quadrilineatus TaxID=74068 RepID=UPI0023E142D1|nr:uncharacterized protein LOC129001665 [Macrosteles quadrilineatus]